MRLASIQFVESESPVTADPTETDRLVSAEEAVKALEELRDPDVYMGELVRIDVAIEIIRSLPAVPQTNEILAHGPICGAENGDHVCSLESGHATEHNCCGVSWPLENPFEIAELKSLSALPQPDAVPQEEGPESEKCYHESMDGVNRTALNDPWKVWRCNSCNALIANGEILESLAAVPQTGVLAEIRALLDTSEHEAAYDLRNDIYAILDSPAAPQEEGPR